MKVTKRFIIGAVAAALAGGGLAATSPFAGAAGPYPPNTSTPQYPSALVNIAEVSNGCGPGPATRAAQFNDTQTYWENELTSYTVDFRPVCELHDAGYTGAEVQDTFDGGYVNYFTWTQEQVDNKFIADATKQCYAKIPAAAKVALAACLGRGQGYHIFGGIGVGSKGVQNFQTIVDDFGSTAYSVRPKIADKYFNKENEEAPGWNFIQHGQVILANWTGEEAAGHGG